MAELQPYEVKEKRRPDLLTILCILTFTGSGLAAFSFTMITMSYEESMQILESSDFNLPGMELLKNTKFGFFLTGAILYTVSLIGAIQMWKLRKIGFHFYATAQVLLLILPLVYIKSYGFQLFDIILSGVFIFLYYRHLKLMH
ncbi:MAG: hypothetical protein U9R60_17745 [Bacteroidota bacterium]|nr:hypothetical protein [Bacteroidota bacterium]